MRRWMVAIFCFFSSMAAFAQSEGPTLYPVIGGHESLPLRVVSKSSLANPASRTEYPPAIPCQFGGTIGNFTIVLNCDGNDSDGTSSYGAVPDTDLAVGDQYYVQTVDNVFTIYNKVDGSVAEGSLPLTTFWNGFQNQSCVTAGAGDDFIVRYDNAASRWVVGLPIFGDAQGKYWLCLAVSTSSDPIGSYYQYAVQEADPANLIWDYPKLGVWTDAYYLGFNMISPRPAYVGPRACAVDRTSMLQGLPAAPMQCFSKRASTDSFMLPSDIAGSSEPSSGEPAFFLDIAHSSTGVHSTLNLWQFHIDFTNSQNSTFSGPTALTVSSFMEGSGYVFEPGRGLLDTRSDRLMVPLAWRPTADGVEHLLVTDAVVSGTNMAEQWFDITNPNGSPAVAQQGTLVPDPHDNFWMGSMNMDKDGDIALGFSNASARIDPGTMFTGRLFADPLNTMEAVQPVIAGTGYQSATQFQWGDHSIMAMDPSDDCTFWYSNEYYAAANTNSDRWSTRIMAFKLTACQ